MNIYTAEEFSLITAARIAIAELQTYDAETRAMKAGKLKRLKGRSEITRKLIELPNWAINEALRVQQAERFVGNHWAAPDVAERLLAWASRETRP